MCQISRPHPLTHSPPLSTFRMDVINVWSLTEKDLKKDSEWRDCRLQSLNLLSLSVTHYFDSFDKVKYT